MLGLIEAVPVVGRGDGTLGPVATTAAAAVVVAAGVIGGRAAASAHSSWSGSGAVAGTTTRTTRTTRTTISTATVPRTAATAAERTLWTAASAIAAGAELVPRVGITHPALRRDDIPVLIALRWSSVAAVPGHGRGRAVTVFRASGEGSWHCLRGTGRRARG